MGTTVEGKSRIVTLTPTITSTPYSSGDQLGVLMEMPNAMDMTSDTGAILSVTVIDGTSQSAAMDILFFQSAPTVASVDNAALNISDSEMAEKFLGAVTVLATDYAALSANSYACIKHVALLVQAHKDLTNAPGNSLYCILQSRGTPTYAAGALTLKIGILQD